MLLVRRHAAFIAVVSLMLAYAWPMQGFGYNQTSHYILVKAFADRTAVVDKALGEVGDLGTQDITRVGDHLYSNKAPGLAGLTFPTFLVLKAAGARTVGDPTQMLWALGLIGTVLPATALVLLVRRVAGAVEPGFGTIAAVAMGLGTLLLPFATMFFAHALSACLVFAAFTILFFERRGRPRPALLVAAGVLAGLAITTEYPTALVGFVLGIYALAGARSLLRGVAFGVGVLAGVVPLGFYNWWAFGSIFHLSYQSSSYQSAGGGEVVAQGLEHIPAPGFRPIVLLETLFGGSGLLTLSPVLVCGAVGTVLLYRRGFRAETLVIVASAALYVFYNSGYGSNFGGFSPGQRYLIPIVPLLAFPLAAAFRAFPVTTGGLALVSSVIAVSTTATYALAGYKADWFDRVGNLEFTPTPMSLVGVTGWYTILPFFLAVVAAGVFAILATSSPRLTTGDMLAAPFAVIAWAVVAATAPKTPALGGKADRLSSYGGVTAVAVVVLLGLLLARLVRSSPRPRGVSPDDRCRRAGCLNRPAGRQPALGRNLVRSPQRGTSPRPRRARVGARTAVSSDPSSSGGSPEPPLLSVPAAKPVANEVRHRERVRHHRLHASSGLRRRPVGTCARRGRSGAASAALEVRFRVHPDRERSAGRGVVRDRCERNARRKRVMQHAVAVDDVELATWERKREERCDHGVDERLAVERRPTVGARG